jgi:hypothetical protein
MMDRERAIQRELNGVEAAVVDLLRDGSPRTLDEITEALPGGCFAQVFLTVDRLSREGLLRLRRGRLSYRVSVAN